MISCKVDSNLSHRHCVRVFVIFFYIQKLKFVNLYCTVYLFILRNYSLNGPSIGYQIQKVFFFLNVLVQGTT